MAAMAIGAALGAQACGSTDTTAVNAPAADASACSTGTTLCGGSCVQTALDPANCGACGTACKTGEVCSVGKCANSCGAGTKACGASCSDTTVDPKNCGACGTACKTGEVCSAGKCGTTCTGGTSLCGAACTDPMVDPNNCGGCGTACKTGEVCSSGKCGVSCGAGLILCGSSCIDATSNPKFCGATAGCGLADAGSAGTVCGMTQACSQGVCADLLVNPVPTGIAALYDARNSGSVVRDANGNVTQWNDLSGNGRNLVPNNGAPVYKTGLINNLPGIDFAGAKGMISAAFPLTAEVTVFAVVQWGVPGAWGNMAHHGNRDNDWSLEQNANKTNVTHWQSQNDNANVELTLVPSTNYLLTGRIQGQNRYYSATTTATTVSTTGTGVTIVTGSKILYVGKSDINEAFNGKYGELLYYNRALSDVERDKVIAYLQAGWGF